MSDNHITPNAQAFITANSKSPVVSGYAFGNGGEGGRFNLKNGKHFDLTAQEAQMVGEIKWDFSK